MSRDFTSVQDVACYSECNRRLVDVANTGSVRPSLQRTVTDAQDMEKKAKVGKTKKKPSGVPE